MKSYQSKIKKAKNYLDNHYCIGVPTETVYGLAANATLIMQLKRYIN